MNRNYSALVHALDIAKEQNLPQVLQVFQESLDRMLISAATSGNDACVKELINAGANVNYMEENCYGHADLALQELVIEYYRTHCNVPEPSSVIELEASHNLECTFCLRTVDVKTADTGDIPSFKQHLAYQHAYRIAVSPLSAAVTHRKLSCVKTLLDAGANACTDIGRVRHIAHLLHLTPHAIALIQGDIDVLEELLTCGQTLMFNGSHIDSVHDNCWPKLLAYGMETTWLTKHTPLTIAAGSKGAAVSDPAEDKPYSLKHLSRIVIRQELLNNNRRNLFVTATTSTLPLPKSLCRYLVHDYEL